MGRGRGRIATFSVEIQIIVFIPRNVPIHPFGQPSGHQGRRPCPFSETGASPQGKGWRFSGKRWESRYTNREKAGCRSRNECIPVQYKGRLRGDEAGYLRECALLCTRLKNAGIFFSPRVLLLNFMLPDHLRVSSNFRRFWEEENSVHNSSIHVEQNIVNTGSRIIPGHSLPRLDFPI